MRATRPQSACTPFRALACALVLMGASAGPTLAAPAPTTVPIFPEARPPLEITVEAREDLFRQNTLTISAQANEGRIPLEVVEMPAVQPRRSLERR